MPCPEHQVKDLVFVWRRSLNSQSTIKSISNLFRKRLSKQYEGTNILAKTAGIIALNGLGFVKY